jgi:hypothetical protein
MKAYQEITITSNDLDDESLIKTIEEFGSEAALWNFYPEKSAEYAKLCGDPACCVVCGFDDIPKSAVHVTKKKPGKFYVPNIVPIEIHELSRDQYNTIASCFVSELRAHCRKSKTHISIFISKPDIGTAEVIPGKIPRKFFDRYISLYPRSHHPLDIQRLDKFICALARYSRTLFDFERFERLLVEDYGWQKSDAEWCRTRVETGIDILNEYKRF